MANEQDKRRIKVGQVLYTAFDEYKIVRQIGQGGNGIVYEASNSSEELFAVKIVDISKLSSQKRKRFKNELNFSEYDNHKNIIHIIDSGRDSSGTYAFYVMPVYPETLRTRMKQGVTPTDAIELTISLLEGLGFAHSKGICHRDIKPENILLQKNSNECIIADFGIAHFPEHEAITEVETKVGDRIANFQYAAPEQRIAGGTVDGRADVFAVGLILHEMLTGEIILGSDYKKIADCYQGYSFLDDIVELLHKQNPNDRLFPAKRILEDLYARIEIAKSERIAVEKKRLLDDIKQSTDSFTPFKTPEIIGAQVIAGTLTFKLDVEIPKKWFEVFRNESYGHTSVMGYEPSRFHMKNDMELAIGLNGGENKGTLKRIVDYFKQWLPTVTEYYNDMISREQDRRKREEIERIKHDIEEQERNRNMNELIQSLI